MEIKIKYSELKDLEFYLFSLKFQKKFDVKVIFDDSPEEYEYETIPQDDFYILVTK